MGITIALFALFLLVLVAVAFAAARLLGGRDAAGKREVGGCLTGCAVGLGLFVLGALGLAAFVAAMVTQTASTALEHNPIRRIALTAEPDADPANALAPFAQDPRRPLHLLFEIDGHDATPAGMLSWIDRWSDGDARVHTRNSTTPKGRPITLVDVALSASRRDLRQIERDVREVVPEADWSHGLRIEFRGASREW